MTETFTETRVVSRNFLIDFLQGFRNILGWRLRGYEDVINDNTREMLSDLEDRYEIDWHRIQIDPLTKASAVITIYGEGELK